MGNCIKLNNETVKSPPTLQNPQQNSPQSLNPQQNSPLPRALYPSSQPQPQPQPPSLNLDLEKLRKPCYPFSMVRETHLGYCVKAYDGDTCTINIRSNIGDHQWKIRLAGFDAPELKTSNSLEKKHGLACRDMLLELIHNKYIVVQCDKFEKYGRLLGTIWVRASQDTNSSICTESCELSDVKNMNEGVKSGLINVNDWMLKHTPCVPYDGGTKAGVTYTGSYHPHYLRHLKH